MSQAQLEQTLRDLPAVGTLVKDRPYRQVWRFEHEARPYYLKFYPREGVQERFHHVRDWFRRLGRGSPAVLEFSRLQLLQRAKIAAPRPVAVLVGFRLNGQLGDAVIMEAIEPAVPLDQYLNDFLLNGERAPDHRQISKQVRDLVHELVVAKLGHDDLHLGNFLIKAGKVYLLDGYAVRRGMRSRDVFRLAHSASPFATVTDLRRGWNLLVGGGSMPRRNPISAELRRAFLKRIGDDNRYFGRLRMDDWSGVFFRETKFARRWSESSRLRITREQWESVWKDLLEKLHQDRLTVLKRGRSGDVLATRLPLGGRSLDVILKRPRKRYWYRYLNEFPRPSRSWRSWVKSWSLIARNLPTAWPLLVMERRRFGYVLDQFAIYERVPGKTLARFDLETPGRDLLFRRAGHLLRKIDESGLSHFDAKASNWIVLEDPKLGPSPVLIDADAIRFRRWMALGIRRLLRSMKEHPQYTREDSLSLCLGYSPYSTPSADADAGAAESQAAPSAGEVEGTPG